jgi:hypothetical protein
LDFIRLKALIEISDIIALEKRIIAGGSGIEETEYETLIIEDTP